MGRIIFGGASDAGVGAAGGVTVSKDTRVDADAGVMVDILVVRPFLAGVSGYSGVSCWKRCQNRL
jgi:hypothetical protein